MKGGWEDFAEGRMVFMKEGEGQSSSTEDKGRTIENWLLINYQWRGGGGIRMTQSLIGETGKF